MKPSDTNKHCCAPDKWNLPHKAGSLTQWLCHCLLQSVKMSRRLQVLSAMTSRIPVMMENIQLKWLVWRHSAWMSAPTVWRCINPQMSSLDFLKPFNWVIKPKISFTHGHKVNSGAVVTGTKYLWKCTENLCEGNEIQSGCHQCADQVQPKHH